MNTILLEPTDVLFFRDGRPMGGSLSGHGAAWPLPTVINHAFHAALHRAELNGVHTHRRGRSGKVEDTRDRKFGSLTTAGPFPVAPGENWFFPRPLDAGSSNSTEVTYLPLPGTDPDLSSLPGPLKFAVGNTKEADKSVPKPWWNTDVWKAYLDGATPSSSPDSFKTDADFSDTESTFGIGIDPATGTQDGEQFYSASYLRLRPECKLGLFAEAPDKVKQDSSDTRDLIPLLLKGHGTQIITGGQQRTCTATLTPDPSSLPLPTGMSDGFTQNDGKFLVKWILLTPAVFPAINEHTGGWLPSWIRHGDGQVMLKQGDTSRHGREGRSIWRKRIASMPEIPATLVAAITGKAIPVTGYALPNEADPDRAKGGPKSTHLAVPAGSIYYFECDNEPAAKALAAALNWHGSSPGTQIQNRRSTLMGEKGFGLGVCGTWHDAKPQGKP